MTATPGPGPAATILGTSTGCCILSIVDIDRVVEDCVNGTCGCYLDGEYYGTCAMAAGSCSSGCCGPTFGWAVDDG